MASQEEIESQQKLLVIYRRNLESLLNQIAQFGGISHTPLNIINEIREARDSIREIKSVLRVWGIPVEDRIVDEENRSNNDFELSKSNIPRPILESIWKRNSSPKSISSDSEILNGKQLKEVNFLDLSFVLLLSTFFSLLLVEALVISGRSVTIFTSTVAMFASAIVTVVTLIFLWRRKRAEFGIGCWSILVLLVLVLAPGGPFTSGDKEGIPIISFWVPILTLVLLSSATWMYELGNPLDKTLSFSKRFRVVIIVVLVASIANLSLGKQYKIGIENDQRTPDISSEKTRSVLDRIYNWDVSQKRSFYAAASEIRLLDYYSRSRQLVGAESSFDSPIGIVSSISPNRRSELLSFFQDLNYSVDRSVELTDKIIELINNKQDESKFISFFQNIGFSDKRAELLTIQLFDIYRGPSSSSLRDQRLTQVLRNFTALPREDQQSYLTSRLRWIHPVGLLNQDQSTVNLPGIKSEERIATLSTERIRYALSNQNSQVKELVKEFNYVPEIVAEFDPESSQARLNSQYEGIIPPLTNKKRDLPNYFDNLGSQPFVPRLKEQLSFPSDYESALAFDEYDVVTRGIIKSDLVQQGVPRAKVEEIFEDLDRLEPKARDAFIYYCITHEIDASDNYQALLTLRSFDFSSLNRNDDAVAAVPRLVSMIETGAETDPTNPLSDTAKLIRDIQSATNRQKILNLLRTQNPTIPVHNLLDKKIFDAVTIIDSTLNAKQVNEFFSAIRNPIKPTIYQLITNGVIVGISKEEALSTLEMFSGLNDAEQEGLLQQLALSLYRTEGKYAHSIFNLMVLQANLWDESAGVLVASLICSPLVILMVVLGAYAARRLAARDILRGLMITEAAKQNIRSYEIGTTDFVRGRESIISQLRRLAGRGWSSIAVVGRRGVGKTRILYSLMHPDETEEGVSAIKAWVAAPSKFDETEFVESVLERLTADVEDAIARRLGAKPLEVRRLEVNSTLRALLIYMFFVSLIIATFSLMSSQVANGQIVSTWFPAFVIFATSIAILLAHISKVQPVNLSPWLERDRSNSPHTVLLYREARQVRDFLDERRRMGLAGRSQLQFVDYMRISLITFALIAILVFLAVTILYVLIYISSPNSSAGVSATPIVILVSFLVCTFLVALVLMRTGKAKISRGYSLMSLISTYREFVERMVFRIRQGALGKQNVHDFEVVVCIDELDKIVDSNELRDFLRRMKVIFEIPGAYYYLSLSEDALKSLYLGSVEGKNEIDSAFDHILYIPPVDCELGSEVARSYLSKHTERSVMPRMERMIAAISYGVPRDIIRRCDELLIKEAVSNVEPWRLSDEFRRKQAELAYNEQLLTKAQFTAFNSGVEYSIEAIAAYFEHDVIDSKPSRIILALWVLSLMSISSMLSEHVWIDLSEKLRDIGYRIPGERIETLIDELRNIHLLTRSSGNSIVP